MSRPHRMALEAILSPDCRGGDDRLPGPEMVGSLRESEWEAYVIDAQAFPAPSTTPQQYQLLLKRLSNGWPALTKPLGEERF